MKKLVTLGLASIAVFCAGAQTTGALSPSSQRVFAPETYNNVIRASYDNLINANTAQVQVKVGEDTFNAAITPNGSYSFNIAIFDALKEHGKNVDNTEFTVNVTNVAPADTINTTVQDLTGTYLYRATMPTFSSLVPEAGSKLENKAQTVTVTFADKVKVEHIAFMSGPMFSPVYNRVDGSADFSNTVTAEILDTYWSDVETPATITVTLENILLENGFYIPNISFEYTYGEAVTAEFVEVIPTSAEATVADMYGYQADFYYTAAVEMSNPNAAASVEYYDLDGDIVDTTTITADEVFADLDWWSGNYYLSVPIPSIDGMAATEFSKIVVTVQGITSNGVNLPNQSVTYNAATSRRIKSNGTTGVASGLISGNELVDVYNLQGVIVLKNVQKNEVRNTLESGVYVINGKKVAIRK